MQLFNITNQISYAIFSVKQNNPEVENHVIAYITLFRRLLTISEEFSVPVVSIK